MPAQLTAQMQKIYDEFSTQLTTHIKQQYSYLYEKLYNNIYSGLHRHLYDVINKNEMLIKSGTALIGQFLGM